LFRSNPLAAADLFFITYGTYYNPILLILVAQVRDTARAKAENGLTMRSAMLSS
jgi:hypothetical protein